jgi:A118 family predicted phage portal protein
MKLVADAINRLGIKTYTFDYSIYSNAIDLWNRWYCGNDTTFHVYDQYNGLKNVTRIKSKLHMASQVCRDHSSLTCNENISIMVDNSKEKDYLLGFDEMTGLLGQNDFWSQLGNMYELTCALGTGAYEIVVENLLQSSDSILAGPNSKLKLTHHNAMEILPLSWDNNGFITEVCFVDQYKIKDKQFIELRIHVLEDGQYVIINKRAETFGNTFTFINFDNNIVDKFYTGSNIPWFSILKLPINNTYDIKSPMGMSVYGNSIDILKNIDEAFDSLCVEYRSSKKKTFYHKSLLSRDTVTGEVQTPDSLNKTDFFFVGQGQLPVDGNKLPIEYVDPKIRVAELTAGIESALNYLSFTCGLGANFYKFSAGTVTKTATEVISENSDLYRNIKHNEISVEKFVLNLMKSILNVSNLIFKTKFNIDIPISVKFDTSIIEDKQSERQRDLTEVQAGIMTIEEYREKWYESPRRDTVNPE